MKYYNSDSKIKDNDDDSNDDSNESTESSLQESVLNYTKNPKKNIESSSSEESDSSESSCKIPVIKTKKAIESSESEVDTSEEDEMPNIVKEDNNTVTCNFCGGLYSNDTVVPYEDNNVCWHCIFSLNYSIYLRKNVDGMFGMSIVNYIFTYANDHNKENCQKNNMCFLCDYLNGKTITDVQNSEVLIGNEDESLNANSDCESDSEEEIIIKI